MDGLIQISKINDFLFCPMSLYNHSIYESFDQKMFHSKYQTIGKIKHESIDNGKYSSLKRFLQGNTVYSQKYNIIGKIDIYDTKTKSLIERKFKINHIYKGYVYQLIAQYFCLVEKNISVEHLFLHSLKDNKRYEVNLPDQIVEADFSLFLRKIRNFNPNQITFVAEKKKCLQCIYSTLCNYNPC
ncbi:MAG: type V CRISPR-associated protein Cas4 [Candidatus Shapirobacteria bacterium]|nr:type V CRISPR-associated protein Cas4 [Candidatus Shapirobacteria bacterium]